MPSHREPGLRMIDAGDGRVFEVFEQIEPRREDRVSCVVLAPKARFGDGGDRLRRGSDTELWKPWQSWGVRVRALGRPALDGKPGWRSIGSGGSGGRPSGPEADAGTPSPGVIYPVHAEWSGRGSVRGLDPGGRLTECIQEHAMARKMRLISSAGSIRLWVRDFSAHT